MGSRCNVVNRGGATSPFYLYQAGLIAAFDLPPEKISVDDGFTVRAQPLIALLFYAISPGNNFLGGQIQQFSDLKLFKPDGFMGCKRGLICNYCNTGGSVANLLRLIFCLLLLFSSNAYAAHVPANFAIPSPTTGKCPNSVVVNGSTLSAAVASALGVIAGCDTNIPPSTPTTCGTTTATSQDWKWVRQSSCGATLTAAVTCPAGYNFNGTDCDNDTCSAKKNTNLSSGKYDWGVDPEAVVLTVCDGQCSAIFEGAQAVARYLDNGKYHYLAQGAYVYDGYACSVSTPLGSASDAKTETPPDTCPELQVLGYVNFKAICVNAGVAQNPHTPKAPARTNTTTTTVTNPDGSTTKITETTHEDGSTTTTTTTIQPNGDITVEGTTTPAATDDPVDDMCKQNPSLPICKGEKSSFSGACGAFVCEGDAIQCALGSEIHKRNCTMFEEKTALSELGDSLGQGTDSGVSANPAKTENRESITLPSSLSMGGSITARCMSDMSVQVMSTTVTIPFSTICPYLEIMGKIVVAMSLLVAARIVGGGIA